MWASRLLSCLGFLVVIVLTSGVEFRCRNLGVMVGQWNGFGAVFTCNLATVISLENPTTVTGINGNQSNAAVQAFRIVNHKILNAIPYEFENFYPNLDIFEWYNGNITTIDSDIFKLPKLVYLDLGGNQIVTLESNLFQNTPKLWRIYFDRGLLEHVGHDLMTELVDLRFAYFAFNTCVSINANTREEVQEVNRQLPILCPPSAVTETTTHLVTSSMHPQTTTESTGRITRKLLKWLKNICYKIYFCQALLSRN